MDRDPARPEPTTRKALDWLLHLARKPAMLAQLLEAMPAETLERAGRVVRERVTLPA